MKKQNLKSRGMLYLLSIYSIIVSGVVYFTEEIFNIPLIIILITFIYTITFFEPWSSLKENKKNILCISWSLVVTLSLDRTLVLVSTLANFYEYILKYEIWITLLGGLIGLIVYVKVSESYLSKAFEDGGLLWKEKP